LLYFIVFVQIAFKPDDKLLFQCPVSYVLLCGDTATNACSCTIGL